ncbi:hypothetical protein HK405_007701, partial [Cladochytrium tenue]
MAHTRSCASWASRRCSTVPAASTVHLSAATRSPSSASLPAPWGLAAVCVNALVAVLVLALACFPPGAVCSTAGSVQQKHLEDALAHLAATRYNEALSAFDRAAESDPTNYMIFFRRATTYLSLGRISSAIRDFSKVLDLRPNFDQALLQRGKLYLKTCDLEAAVADLSIYVKSNPSDGGASEA